MLQVKKFHADAVLPTVAHPGTDLGYDLYTCEAVILLPGQMTEVRTGIGICLSVMACGFLVKDRSSFAKRRLVTSGGVIDAGYRGEIIVFMDNRGSELVRLEKGQKFAQLIPIPTLTRLKVEEVTELPPSERGEGGFGSSDKKSDLIVPDKKIVLA